MWDHVSWFETLGKDFRHALRVMGRRPVTFGTAAISLSLAVAANATIFALLNTILWHPLPLPRPDRLVQVTRPAAIGGFTQDSFPGELCDRLRESGVNFADVFTCGYPYDTFVSLGAGDDQLEPVKFFSLSANAFGVLGVRPALGRLFDASDARAGAEPVAVISYEYWRKRFGSATNMSDRRLSVQDRSFRIIGVLQSGFSEIDVGTAPDVWIPIVENQGGRVLARLRPGVRGTQLLATLQEPLADFLLSHPPDRQGADRLLKPRLQLVSAERGLSATGLRTNLARPLTIAIIAAAVVLLIACSNIGILLLAQGAGRQREIALRVALGAGSGRIVRQLLTETVLFTTVGCGLGLLLTRWGSSALVSLVSPSDLPARIAPHPDLRIVGFSAALCVAVTLICGLVPALRAPRVQVNEALRNDTDYASPVRGGLRLSEAFIIVQVALSLILLLGAGMLLASLRNLNRLDSGFDKDHTLVVDLQWRRHGEENGYTDPIYRALLRNASAVPGVISASISGWSYFGANSRRAAIVVEGSASRPEDGPLCEFMSVGPDFFRTMNTTVIQGREFDYQDTPHSPLVALVSASAARLYFGAENPVGKRFHIFDPKEVLEIVGVVRDAKLNNLREATQPIIYLPFLQSQYRGTTDTPASLEVRVAGRPGSLAPILRREVRAVSSDLQVRGIGTGRDLIDASLLQERMLVKVAGWLGLYALLLAAIGLYGVVNHMVTRRTQELGIRLALGASGRQLVRMLLRTSLSLVLAGAIIGIPVALVSSRLLRAVLFGVGPGDPTVVATALVVLGAAATIAAWLPVHRVARVDPAATLRHE